MKPGDRLTKPKGEQGSASGEFPNGELDIALGNFRRSVHAWSEAAWRRPRPVVSSAAQRTAWRKSVAWVLSLALSAGMVSIGVQERHHRQELARQEQQKEVERQRALAEQHAREAEDLLAKVDSDVAREVPSAMEPLAQLMMDDFSK